MSETRWPSSGTAARLLSIPVIGSPLFIVSNPDLVIAQCKAGIVGAFPALNARPEMLEGLTAITTELRRVQAGASRRRRWRRSRSTRSCTSRTTVCSTTSISARSTRCRSQIPARAPDDVVKSANRYGGLVFHDVINVAHAKRAAGRRGRPDPGLRRCRRPCRRLSPFALVPKCAKCLTAASCSRARSPSGARRGPGRAGAGRRPRLSRHALHRQQEANATEGNKQCIIESSGEEIVYTNLFTGVHGNYLKRSIAAAGLDPDALPEADKSKMNFGSGGNAKAKAWRDIWGAGQGVGQIFDAPPAAEIVAPAQGRVRGLVRGQNAARLKQAGEAATPVARSGAAMRPNIS